MKFKDIKKGDKIIDKETGFTETVLDVTSNSVRVTFTKTNPKGINGDHWITDKDFEKSFTLNPTP